MSWKNIYITSISIIVLKILIRFGVFSSAFSLEYRFNGFIIVSIIIYGLHFFYLFVLNKAITKEGSASQKLKVLEYLNYGVMAYYIYGFLTTIVSLYLLFQHIFSSDKFVFVYFIFTWVLSGILIYLLFQAFKHRKQHFGKFNDPKTQNVSTPDTEGRTNHSFSTVDERLVLCKVCTNRKLNMETGLVCDLTNEKPVFTSFCNDYVVDQKKKEKQLELQEVKQKKGFLGSWKGALVMSILGFARAAMRGFEEPMGLIFFGLGIAWLILALAGNNKE